MTKPISYRWRQPRRHMVLLFAACVIFSILRTAMGQPEDVPADLRNRVPVIGPDGTVPPGSLPPGMVDEQGRPIAHVHNANMSCCAPCAPETNTDPDVCKRPCFTRALGKARKYRGECDGLTGAAEVRLTQDRMPAEVIERFRGLLHNVLQVAYLPHGWNEVQFFVPSHLTPVIEIRDGVRVYAGVQADRTAEARELRERDAIVTGWTIGDIEVLPVKWHRAGRSRKDALIRLRIHGAERLELGQRPKGYTRSVKDSPAFFNPDAFHLLLTKILRVPFESPDDFLVDGYDTDYARSPGVRVFHGEIRSRERSAQLRADRSAAPAHWWDEMRLFVTDSEPQYFCVQITLREGDNVEPASP